MTRVLRTDYAAVNAMGVTLYTFNDIAKGRAWVRDNAALHDGLVLEEISVVARRVYRPPSAAVRARRGAPDFVIPPYAEARA